MWKYVRVEANLIDPFLVSSLLKLPYTQLWSEYDEEADLLYLSFRKPQGANDRVMGEDGNIYNYRDGELVGVTVMNASKRLREWA